MPRLILKRRAEVLAEYRTGKKQSISIGSSRGNDIVIHDKNVSEQHCIITRKNDSYEIRDNNTLTGTRVNDRNVSVKELVQGDSLGIGFHTIIFSQDTRPGSALVERKAGNKSYVLLGVYGRFEGRKYELKSGETHIGRENISPKGITNDIVLSGDMTVSKGHAKITCEGDHCLVMDVGSTGGVAVNGAKLGQLNETVIEHDSEISIGRTIFRFVEAGKEHYAAPRHSIWVLKARKPVLVFLSMLVLGVAGLSIYQGLSSFRQARRVPERFSAEHSLSWIPSENLVRTIPPDYDISSTPAIGDLNGDGINEAVYLNSSGMLYAWDGKTGQKIWRSVEVFNSGKSSPVLADMNNDGVLDIVTVTDGSMLYILDGRTGTAIRREVLGGTVSEMTPAVGDLDGDGVKDVVICSEEGMVHFVYAPGYPLRYQKYTEYIEGPVYASPVIASGKKMTPLVVVCANNSMVYFFDERRSKKSMNLVEQTGKPHLMAAPPAVGDLNGDGIPEVIVQSNTPQYVSCLNLGRFNVNWTYFVEPIPPTDLRHSASPLIIPFAGGVRNVVVLSANGSLYILKGATGYPSGELVVKSEIPGGKRMVAPPALYDFTKDGIPEIIMGTEDGSIVIAHMDSSGRTIDIAASVRAGNAPITASPLIADINGDGFMEIIYATMANAVQTISTNVATFRSLSIWPMYMGSASLSGAPAVSENTGPAIRQMAVGAGGLLFFGCLLLIIQGRRWSKRPRVVFL